MRLRLDYVVAAYPIPIKIIPIAAAMEVAIPVRFDRIQPDIPKLPRSVKKPIRKPRLTIPISGWMLGLRSSNVTAFVFNASDARIDARKVTPINNEAAIPDVATAHDAIRRFGAASSSNVNVAIEKPPRTAEIELICS